VTRDPRPATRAPRPATRDPRTSWPSSSRRSAVAAWRASRTWPRTSPWTRAPRCSAPSSMPWRRMGLAAHWRARWWRLRQRGRRSGDSSHPPASGASSDRMHGWQRRGSARPGHAAQTWDALNVVSTDTDTAAALVFKHPLILSLNDHGAAITLGLIYSLSSRSLGALAAQIGKLRGTSGGYRTDVPVTLAGQAQQTEAGLLAAPAASQPAATASGPPRSALTPTLSGQCVGGGEHGSGSSWSAGPRIPAPRRRSRSPTTTRRSSGSTSSTLPGPASSCPSPPVASSTRRTPSRSPCACPSTSSQVSPSPGSSTTTFTVTLPAGATSASVLSAGLGNSRFDSPDLSSYFVTPPAAVPTATSTIRRRPSWRSC